MTRTLFIIHVLLTLLSSSWVQAASVHVDMPNQTVSAEHSAQDADALPPCHQGLEKKTIGASTDNKMSCCIDAQCQCDGLCQSVGTLGLSLTLLSSHSSPLLVAFNQQSWAEVSPLSLFRPPIHTT